MPNFGRTDKHDSSKGYARVVWGEGSKVLDVELTEMQKIFMERVDKLGRALFSDGFLTKDALTYSSGTLTVPISSIVLNGRRIDILDPMTITVGASTSVWLAMWEQEVAYTNTIKRSGNQSGGVDLADNGILDGTFGSETTRRIQTQVQLVTSNADASKTYLEVVSIDASSVVNDLRKLATTKATELTIGGRFKLRHNPVTDSLDIVVV